MFCYLNDRKPLAWSQIHTQIHTHHTRHTHHTNLFFPQRQMMRLRGIRAPHHVSFGIGNMTQARNGHTPPDKKLDDLQSPGWFEMCFRPFLSTSQEKWFKRKATTTAYGAVLVVTAPRGFRKTTTAERVCMRNFHPFFKFEYVHAGGDGSGYERWMKKASGPPSASDLAFDLLGPMALVAVFLVLYHAYIVWKKQEKGETPFWSRLWA